MLAPGLIDSHVHPVFGDWTPRQNQLGWIDSFLMRRGHDDDLGGRSHLPGRPKDSSASRRWRSPRSVPSTPSGPAASRCMPEPRCSRRAWSSRFQELAAAGVTLLGEVGLGGVKGGADGERMVAWARNHGIQSTIHTGGPSIPGSGLIDKDVVLEADADVIGHINGGHTALPEAHVS